jgi:steroid delta-isomerase-like uncharacterized protein
MDHAATMRRVYELISAGDIEGFGGLVAENLVEHEELPGYEPTKDGVMQWFTTMRAAFPDMRMEASDVIASDDKVVIRGRFTGTHQGNFMGIPASGKSVDTQLIDICRFDADGKIVEHWGLFDELRMLQQLGVVPEGPPA